VSGLSAVVDTNIFISARNPAEAGYKACRALLDRIDTAGLRAILSAITIAELRAGVPAHQVASSWRPMLTHFLTSPNYQVEPVDSEIADTAGELRATAGLTVPDAIVIATAQLRGAAYVISQDVKLRRQHLPLRVFAPNALP
jgi:predicted nucleic acid-binding protein